MFRRIFSVVTVWLIVLTTAQNAMAWGAQGHQVVALIAAERLTDRAQCRG